MTAHPWASHRQRAEALRGRYPFAGEVLGLYVALLDVWELAGDDPPPPRDLVAWAAERVLPQVVKATEAAGPQPLAEAAREFLAAGGVERPLATWLAGGELPSVERYLARAALCAPLVALGPDAGAACADDPAPRGDRYCPCCGGLPQVSVRGGTDDPLVSGHRYLRCARCGQRWSYAAGSCPSCGETSGAKRTVYAERHAGPVVARDGDAPEATFPHLRIDACTSCERYLIDVDLGRDPRAVPEVDELAALPLDLYAADRGLTKITANLMGF
jgi:FdhE protein